MRLRGFAVYMVPDSVVWHKGSETVKRQPGQLVTFYQERNRLLNCLLLYSVRTLVMLIPYFIADACAKIAMSVIAGRKSFVGILRSYWWVLVHWGWVVNKRKECQQERRIPDSEILGMMSTRIIDSESVPASILNNLSTVYARVAGLTHG
jgi:hypothetical protein